MPAAPLRHERLRKRNTSLAIPVLDVAHIVGAVIYMASLPLDANVQFLTVMAAVHRPRLTFGLRLPAYLLGAFWLAGAPSAIRCASGNDAKRSEQAMASF